MVNLNFIYFLLFDILPFEIINKDYVKKILQNKFSFPFNIKKTLLLLK